MTKPCPACEGKGSKLSKFLGTPDDPCPECAGRGAIEVVEEPLTPWQQEVVTLLREIRGRLEIGPLAAQIAEQIMHTPLIAPARLFPPTDLKPLDISEQRKP